MKKVLIFFLFIASATVEIKAQFLNSWGITGGVSYCTERYRYRQPQGLERKKYLLGYNGSLFIELSDRDYVRWIAEVQYNQKGAIDKKNGSYRNKLDYVCFNNYLKIRKELIKVIPYVLLGPRIEFLTAQSTAAPPIVDLFAPLHISVAMGVGTEFVSYSSVSFFVEAFYNPDILDAYETYPLFIKHQNFELRVGLKFLFGGRGIVCNIPRG